MTATLAADCTSIVLDSDYLLVDNQSNVLTVTHNNTTTYTPTVGAVTSITVTSAFLDLSGDTLADGIYTLTLETTAENGDINTETSCVAVLCGVHCSMVELYGDVANLEKVLAYEALKVAQGCATCNCTTMLSLYNVLINIPANDCGCE